MSAANEIRDLNKIYLEAVYGDTPKKKEEPKDTRMILTRADKKANTPAWQNRDKKNPKTGKSVYRMADHLKDDKDWGYDKEGNSLNPVDIEKKKKKDDDLAGAPNVKESGSAGTGPIKANFGAEDIAKAHHKEAMPKLKKSPVKNEELIQVRKLVEKVLTPGAKLAKLRADDDLAGAPKKPWNKVRKVTDQETSQKVRDRQGTWKNEEVETDPGMEHNLEVLGMLSEKEVDVKDTRRTVDAIRAYDKSKDASRDATYDSDEGKKGKAAKERKYAAKERGEIDKDDPNWKKRKYHTGIHGEEVEILKGLVESGKFSDEEIAVMAWDVYEGYQRNPEKGEEEERKAEKKREAIPGQARRGMPPRGDKKREEFERWYAANVR
jgi:hypothetical protein